MCSRGRGGALVSCWSLTAVRAYPICKTRLSACLSPERRIELVSAMLHHVIAVLEQVRGIDRVVVVSPERHVLPETVLAVDDRGGELNHALTAAAEEARRRGADRLVIVHGDLPLLKAEEVTALTRHPGAADSLLHRTVATAEPMPCVSRGRSGSRSSSVRRAFRGTWHRWPRKACRPQWCDCQASLSISMSRPTCAAGRATARR